MDILNKHFGLPVAYLLPGFVALFGFARLVPTVALWLRTDQSANLGAPVYAMLGATAAGMVVSCFRWLIVDRVLELTGVPAPVFNARALEERPAAFGLLVESHYRYFQFYANLLVAVIWTYAVYRVADASVTLSYGTDAGTFVLCVTLFAGARDALAKYRDRVGRLAGPVAPQRTQGEPMTNGIDHGSGPGTSSPEKPKPEAKPPAKPQGPRESK